MVDGIGKILVQCEFISESEIKQHILHDQRLKAHQKQESLRKASL